LTITVLDDEGYSRHAPCALNLTSIFLFHGHLNMEHISQLIRNTTSH